MPSVWICCRGRRLDSKIEFSVSAGALLWLAALLLLLPLQWVFALILAVCVHECAHGIAVCLTGGSILGVHIGGTGTVLVCQPMSGVKEVICAVAGPISSLLLLLLIPRMPRTAICGAVHGLYNLIPLIPLDGGRILRCIVEKLFSPSCAGKVFSGIQIAIRIVIAALCVLASGKIGILALVFGLVLVRRQQNENLLANRPFWRYNNRSIDKGVQL